MHDRQLGVLYGKVMLACVLVSLSQPLSAQGAKKTASETAASSEQERNGTADRVVERQQWLRSGRTALGENSAELLHRAYQQKAAMRAIRIASARTASRIAGSNSSATNSSLPSAPPPASLPSAFSNLNWSNLGPAPIISDPTNAQSYGFITGRVTAIAVDQKEVTGNTVYVGGAFGGVWKSTNAASANAAVVTWAPLFDAQPTLSISSIAIQPGSNTILVGTGEPNSAGDSYYGMGIFRSTDGGANWTEVPSANGGTRSFRGLGFAAIAFSTTNPNLVVASAAATIGASDGGETQGPGGRGLYYSTDAGQSWSYATVTDPNGSITQAGSSNAVVFNPSTNTFYAHLRYHGYYSSSDGASWTRMVNQPGTALSAANCPAATNTQTCPTYRADLTVRPDTGEMYTIFVDSNSQTTSGGGIYKFTNPGWGKLGETGIDLCAGNGGAGESGCGTQQGTFNLYLRAVPNGSSTDIYMGAINIFKCSASVADPLCGSSGAWKNLTHAYGCTPTANPAHVHPDQHAIAYSQGNLAIIYFGNDGGLYRTVNSPGLNSGSCSASNPFDNLNSGIGSLSEFVSFSQHPSDAGILLAGLQDNGSPAINLSNSGLTWTDINSGDGGFNAIDPSSPNIFYTANFGVSIQRCTSGLTCDPNSFPIVVGAATVGGDTSAFYLPYLLDPAISSNLIVGTCRVWRGNGDGSGFTALSANFSPGGGTSCTGDSSSGDSKIRALAVGGPNNGNGSEVIYAGMVGHPPVAGHIFVTADADDTPPVWTDVTGNINPSAYDVSDVVISPYDPSGLTAYLTIMGFGAGHVFKTVNAGATWTDLTSNLPDAPANSVAVDPISANIIYVGMDVGVFVSTDDGTSWSELGTGLPSVPAIKLLVFNSNGVRKLRAATYGRGIWELDFSMLPAVAVSSQTLSFPAQMVGVPSASQALTVTNSGTTALSITAIAVAGAEFRQTNNCPITLAAHANCTINVTFTASAGGTHTGTLSITDNAAGSPQSVSLNGSISTPGISVTPSALTFPGTLVGTTTAPATFQLASSGNSPLIISSVTITGDYTQTNDCPVSIPPSPTSCTFSVTFTPTQTGPRPGSLVISDNAAGSPHSFPISGTGVAQLPELTLSSGALNFAPQNVGSTSSGKIVTVTNNTSSAIQLTGISVAGNFAQTNSCGASLAAHASCTVSITFTPTVGGSAAGSLTLSASDGNQVVAQLSGTGADFIFLGNTVSSASAGAGQTATYLVGFSAIGGFSGQLTLACGGGPAGSTCVANPSSVVLGSGVSSTISVTVPARAALRQSPHGTQYLLAVSLFSIWGLFASLRASRRKLLGTLCVVAVVGLAIAGLSSCGGGGGGGSPSVTAPIAPMVTPNPLAGNYTITVTATSGTLTRTKTLSLQVN